jgi:hypothetical protein
VIEDLSRDLVRVRLVGAMLDRLLKCAHAELADIGGIVNVGPRRSDLAGDPGDARGVVQLAMRGAG